MKKDGKNEEMSATIKLAMKTKKDRINAALNDVPELWKNPLATFPMSLERWVEPGAMIETTSIDDDKVEKVPAFIASKESTGKRKNYVYGPGLLGRGYYHIQTRASYQILSRRYSQQLKSSTPCCGGTQHQAASPKMKERIQATFQIVNRRACSAVPTEDPGVGNQVRNSGGRRHDYLGSGMLLAVAI